MNGDEVAFGKIRQSQVLEGSKRAVGDAGIVCCLSPVIGIFYAYTEVDWFSPKASEEERHRWVESGEAIADVSASEADADERAPRPAV